MPSPRSPPTRSCQKSSDCSDATRKATRCTIPAPARPRGESGILEERDVGARGAALVGVEQVVDGRVVLVHRLLDEAEPERPRVEVDVAGRVARDAR